LVNLIQMTIISTTVDKNPLEEIAQSLESTKESKMQYLGAASKMITVMQIYASTTDAKEAVIDWFYENLQDLL